MRTLIAIGCISFAVALTLAEAPIVHADTQTTQFSGDASSPKRHFRVRNPADLNPAEAQKIYLSLRDKMASLYAVSNHPIAKNYLNWKKYNTAPYISATHGKRYLNNYANKKAMAYVKFEKAGTFLEGSIITKDSFSVTEDGKVNYGPLFIMEKMKKGFNYVSGDWRYIMIMPDGSFMGETNGAESERVKYCIGCHLAKEQFDHLYFLPKEFRIEMN
jgi:hypothetical protein